jgi:protein-tyrosine phosphatase
MIDIHSHILPEIDDGARSLEEAVDMARVAAADGIQQICCTPHMFNGISDNPEPAEVIERVAKLQSDLEANGVTGLRVLPGNEVHVSHEIAEQARTNRVTKLNCQNYMLVEFPTMTVPIGADELFYRLQLNGVRPILVHPERNSQLQSRPSMVADFINRGVFIQVTAMSVTGEFGPGPNNCAESLLRHNCVHFLATDSHRAERRPPILSRGRDAAAAIIGAEKANRLVWDNPLAVVTGGVIHSEGVLPYGGPQDKKPSFFGKFFGR